MNILVTSLLEPVVKIWQFNFSFQNLANQGHSIYKNPLYVLKSCF